MKCVKKTKLVGNKSGVVEEFEVRRVKDKEAMDLVKGDWSYCPKNLWKGTRKSAAKSTTKEEVVEVEEAKEVKQPGKKKFGGRKDRSSYREKKYKKDGVQVKKDDGQISG